MRQVIEFFGKKLVYSDPNPWKKISNKEILATRRKCQRCGECCLYIDELAAKPKDIIRWLKEGRKDILKYLYIEKIDGMLFTDGILAFQEGPPCPFFEQTNGKFPCQINATKPFVCQVYPLLSNKKVCEAGIYFG